MIHIMSDLKETTEEVRKREQELREKQEQLVQAGKLATLGELTTYGIIKDHQGTITVHNRPDDGALFVIQFPLIHLEASGRGDNHATAMYPTG
jgi:C4-dicarboxylate-specific signal transduction histidine kinase